jgi:hypothetical protein
MALRVTTTAIILFGSSDTIRVYHAWTPEAHEVALWVPVSPSECLTWGRESPER